MTSVLIGIATFRRPDGLARILRSLENIESDFNISVFIVDNCCDESAGEKIFSDFLDKYKHHLEYLIVPARGISNVRNAMLDKFYNDEKFEYLAMIDDDQEVEHDWLVQLLNFSDSFDADIVGSLVTAKFDVNPPEWVLELDLFTRKSRTPGVVDIVHGTGGVLIRKKLFEKIGYEYFDKEFGLTGGGDKEFFYRLGKKGAKFAFNDKAICYEYYHSNRLTLDWAEKRAERIGNAEVRLKIKNRDSLIFVMLVATIKLIVVALLYFVYYFNPKRRFRYYLSVLHKIGIFRGALGLTKNVY